jgi:hypothetical protein
LGDFLGQELQSHKTVEPGDFYRFAELAESGGDPLLMEKPYRRHPSRHRRAYIERNEVLDLYRELPFSPAVSSPEANPTIGVFPPRR